MDIKMLLPKSMRLDPYFKMWAEEFELELTDLRLDKAAEEYLAQQTLLCSLRVDELTVEGQHDD